MKLSKRRWMGATILAVILIGVVWVLIGDARDRARLANQRARMAAAGEPTTFAELAPAAISPHANAAILLEQSAAEAAATEREISEAVSKLPEPEQTAFHAGVPAESSLAILRAALTAHPKVVEQLIAASECSHLQPAIADDALTDFGPQLTLFRQQRTAIRLLHYQAMLQLADGDQQGALETCLAMQRLARLTEQNALVVGQLVAFALRGVAVDATNRVLRAGSLPQDAHLRLETELARDNSRESFRDMLRGERVRAMDHFAETVQLSEPLAWMLSIFVDESEYVDFLNLAIEQTDKPFREAAIEMHDAEQNHGMLTRQIAPSLVPSLGSLARNLAATRSLRVLNQLLVQDPDGTQGLAIEQLGLPAEATIDPYDGQRLRMKHSAGGWTVYSVGQNFQDDGGRLDDLSDIGVAPNNQSP